MGLQRFTVCHYLVASWDTDFRVVSSEEWVYGYFLFTFLRFFTIRSFRARAFFRYFRKTRISYRNKYLGGGGKKENIFIAEISRRSMYRITFITSSLLGRIVLYAQTDVLQRSRYPGNRIFVLIFNKRVREKIRTLLLKLGTDLDGDFFFTGA